jgi:hypothetical protein
MRKFAVLTLFATMLTIGWTGFGTGFVPVAHAYPTGPCIDP